MQQPVEVRLATSGDVYQLADLRVEMDAEGDIAVEPAGFREAFARWWSEHADAFVVVVAEADEGIVGTVWLERCRPGVPLATRSEPEQNTVVAGLLRRLWVEPPYPHRFKSLQTMCDTWADEFEQLRPRHRPSLDRGLAREGITLFRTLPATADRTVLLCTDLHAGNVLSARREPWLVIDPKPYVGDPTYDVLQHLLNCGERLQADPIGAASRMADLLDLDPERLRLWLFARCVQESPNCPALADVARVVAPA